MSNRIAGALGLKAIGRNADAFYTLDRTHTMREGRCRVLVTGIIDRR